VTHRERGRLANLRRPHELAFEEYEVPSPGPGALVIQVTRANVCGSDLHVWNGKHPVKKSGGMGHEMMGVVHAIGEGVRSDNAGRPIAVGDRIAFTYFVTCRRCARCRDGQPSLCDNAYEFFALPPAESPHFHTAFATHYYLHPGQFFYRIPEGIPDSVATGANCGLSQVLWGIDRAGLQMGETVMVQGAGGLGLNAIAVAKERGARVIVLEAAPLRLAQAAAFGADAVVDVAAFATNEELIRHVRELTDGHGPDLGIELTGVPAAFAQGLELVRRGGRYLVMGNLSPGETVAFDPGLVTRKALTLYHVDRYEGRYLWKALRFLAEHLHDYPFESLIDAEFPLDELEEALARSAARTVTRAAIVMP
jgi:threonine dehydrogenase-like Zn-dependent dehydrogenase